MKKFFRFNRSKKGATGSATASTESLAATGYLIKEKDLSKLHKAAWTGDIGKVKQLAKRDPSVLDKENRTPLHLACAKGHTAVVEELLEWKAKVNVGDNDARTPLIKAVECGHEDCVRLLLGAHADPNTADKQGDSAMHYAARQGNVSMTQLLLEPERTDIDIRNKDGQTALHIAVVQGDETLADTLLDEGCNPNIQDSEGRTPLMHVCQQGNTHLVKSLLNFSANMHLKDAKGWTADDIAIMASQDSCRELLSAASVRLGESLNSKGTTEGVAERSVDRDVATMGGVAGAAGGGIPAARTSTDHGIYGGPALDQGDEISATEESQSKISEAGGVADSWADTDEESEAADGKRKSLRLTTTKSKAPVVDDIAEADEDVPKDEKIPGLDLTKLLKDSDDSLDHDVGVPSKVKQPVSSGQALGVGGNKKMAGQHPPVSARSSTSIRSALSFGNADNSNWSDDESLFSSSHDPKGRKVTPLKVVGDEVVDDQPSVWSDEEGETGPQPGERRPSDTACKKNGLEESVTTDRSVGVPVATSTARSEDDKGTKALQKISDKHKQMLAELGLSDVSDVSDPDFDEEDVSPPLSAGLMAGQAAGRGTSGRPPPAPAQQQQRSSVSDHWETDTPRSVSKTKVPLSARSVGSNWDSSASEDLEANKVMQPGQQDRESSQKEEESRWDSDTEMDGDATQRSQRPPQAGSVTQPSDSKPKAGGNGEESDWDSETEHEDNNAPPPIHQAAFFGISTDQSFADKNMLHNTKGDDLPVAAPSKHEDSADQRTASIQKEAREHHGTPILAPPSMFKNASQDSLWDSDVEDELAPVTTALAAPAGSTPGETADPPTPPLPSSPPPKLASNSLDKEFVPDVTKDDPTERGVPADEKDDSKWDSDEEEITTPRQTEVRAPPSATVKGAMFGGVDSDEEEEDDEEEEESTWEREKRLAVLTKKKQDKEREEQWEAQYQQRQEQLRREAQEELQRETEEQERLKEESEEDVEQEEDSPAVEEQPQHQQVANQSPGHPGNSGVTSKGGQVASPTGGSHASRSGGVYAEENDDNGPVRPGTAVGSVDRPSPAAAPGRHGAPPGYHASGGPRDDDEDTFNDVDVPDLDTTPIKPRTMSYMPPGAAGLTGGLTSGSLANGQQEDDVLSYSSTEQEASVHEQLVTSQGMGGSMANLNLSFNSDTVSMVRMQEQVREARRLLDKERSTRASMEHKRSNMEKEKSELIMKLEEVTRAKSQLEQSKIDTESKLRTLQYQVSEEVEKRRNAEVLLTKTKEQLTRKENQFTSEVEAKQKAELTLRNLQMELRSTLNSVKQLEEEKDDLMRQLQHEKNARQLQEQLNEEQQRLTEQLRSTEGAAHAQAQAQSASATQEAAAESTEKLRAELYAVKMEFERHKSRFKDDHSLLSAENEELQAKVDDLKADIKLQEEALAHATMQYNLQLSQLKTEHTVLTSSVEKERAARDKLDMEAESLRSRLSSTSSELEKSQAARSELERSSHKEREEWNRLLERRDAELNTLKENNQNLSHRLGAAETKLTSTEHELHLASATLAERNAQLATLQRELDQRKLSHDNLDESFRKDKEEVVRMSARIESLTERVASQQQENASLRQQLDNAHLQQLGREQADSGEKLTSMLATIRADNEKARTILEEKNTLLQDQLGRLREEAVLAESRRTQLEQQHQRAQLDVSEANRRVSVAEAAMEVASKGKEQLEQEKLSLRAEIDRLNVRLEDSRDKLAEAQARAANLAERLDQAERNTMATSQQLMTQSADVHSFAKSKSDLEVELHRLEIENTRLQETLKHETVKVESLQKELADSSQVRQTLEALVTNLKTSHAHLDEKLTTAQKLRDELDELKANNTRLKYTADEAATARTLAAQEAEDSRQLWETEVKGRSKLGLRIAQLEREKQEVVGQVNEEKKKTRKALDLKKSTEAKLENELQKVTQLQKEVATLKAHLKSTKKRLRELDTSDNRINVLQADFHNERREMERTLSTTRRQLEETQGQLNAEVEVKEKLEVKTNQLSSEVNNLSHLQKSHSKLEKAKRKLEEELANYKSHIASHYVERSEVDRIRAELEAKSRVELNAKLEEVNSYLEEQALARQRLDTMRDSNENDMRKEFERTKKELMQELNRLRGNYHETSTVMETKDFEVKRFKDLYESEVKLREQLADRLQQATEKAAKAQLFMDRQLSPNTTNTNPGGGLLLQNNWLSSSTPLVLGKLSPGHGVNDLSAKIRTELNRSIAKHMEKSPHIDISLPARTYDSHDLGASSFTKASTDYLEVLKKNYMLT